MLQREILARQRRRRRRMGALMVLLSITLAGYAAYAWAGEKPPLFDKPPPPYDLRATQRCLEATPRLRVTYVRAHSKKPFGPHEYPSLKVRPERVGPRDADEEGPIDLVFYPSAAKVEAAWGEASESERPVAHRNVAFHGLDPLSGRYDPRVVGCLRDAR